MKDDLFWSKVNKTETCWEWTGSLGTSGYGQIGRKNIYGRRPIGTHRHSWLLHFGKIPDGLNVCHKCDNRICVRPDHLFLGTDKENLDDMRAKGRGFTPFKVKTHCLRGHELNDENVKISSIGARCCIQCRKGSRKRWREKLANSNPEKLIEFRKEQAEIQRKLRSKRKENI